MSDQSTPANGETGRTQTRSLLFFSSAGFAALLFALWAVWIAGFPSPGRSAPNLLMVLGAPVLTWLALKKFNLTQGHLTSLRYSNPAIWIAAALLLQTSISLIKSDYWEPPWIALSERWIALIIALCGALLLHSHQSAQRATRTLGLIAALWVTASCLLLIDASTDTWSQDIGQALWLGREAPFGNPNFVIGGLLPLVVLAWNPQSPRSLIPIGIAMSAAVAMATGITSPYADPVRSVWVILAAMALGWIVLGLTRWAGICLIALALMPLGGQIFLAFDWESAAPLGPSAINRLGIWSGAWQAWLESPLLGVGPGQASNVISSQSSFWPGWLAVPGFPEHAHHEILQALLDGGVINLGFIALAAAVTIAPAWKSRKNPQSRILLTAWIGVASASIIESHLGQPGPLLALAALTAVTWGTHHNSFKQIKETSAIGIQNTFPKLVVAFTAVLATAAGSFALIREHQGFGSPGVQFAIAQKQAALASDPIESLREWQELANRVGDLDVVALIEAQSALAAARHLGEAQAVELARRRWQDQATRMPCHPAVLNIGKRFEEWHRAHTQPEEAETIHEHQVVVVQHCQTALQACPLDTKLISGLRDAIKRLPIRSPHTHK